MEICVWSHAKAAALLSCKKTNENVENVKCCALCVLNEKTAAERVFRYHKNHNNDVSTLSLGIESGIAWMSFNFSRFPTAHTHQKAEREQHTMESIKRGETIAGPTEKCENLVSFRFFFHVLPHRFLLFGELFPCVLWVRVTVTCERAGAGLMAVRFIQLSSVRRGRNV